METKLVIASALVYATERSRPSESQVNPERTDNGSSFFSFPAINKTAHPIMSELLILLKQNYQRMTLCVLPDIDTIYMPLGNEMILSLPL